MRFTLIILAFFFAGIILGNLSNIPLADTPITLIALLVLLVFVGINIGRQPESLLSLVKGKAPLLMLPLCTIVGSLFGASLFALLFSSYTTSETLAVGSGLAYYSLSSVIISKINGAELGTVALLSNVFREILALILIPIIAKRLSPLVAISLGGATTMDTTLPLLIRSCGQNYLALMLFHGFVCDFSVPFMVSFFISL